MDPQAPAGKIQLKAFNKTQMTLFSNDQSVERRAVGGTMRILTFASIKGGVGKTTLAVHVAAALADNGHRTLLMDLDPQGHATAMAGVEMEPESACIADAFGAPSKKTKIDSVLIKSDRENLFVAPANSRMIAKERDLFRWGHRLQAIPRALKQSQYEFDALVIDTPPQLNAYSEAALAIGDLVVVPVPSMAHALQGMDEIQAAFDDITDNDGGTLTVAINLWDRRTSATNAAMEEAFADLSLPLARTRVIRAEVLNQAGLSYQLIFDFAPSSEVALCLIDLAKELWRMAGRVHKN
jgi:chromosome partitioning protein